MSDSTIQLIITSVASLLTIVLTFIIKRSNDKQAAEVKQYRKEVNGHMTALIDTTSKLAASEATAVEKEKGEVKAAEVKAETDKTKT